MLNLSSLVDGMAQYRQLSLGEPAPTFSQRCTSNPGFVFDTVAGRYVVLCFFGSADDAAGKAALEVTVAQRGLFDDDRIAFFGVSLDPNDEVSPCVKESMPGIRHFWDSDGRIARLYGALPIEGDAALAQYRRMWVVLNPGLQVIAVLPFQPEGAERTSLIGLLRSLPPVARYGGLEMHAPILLVPHVLEPGLCSRLMEEYLRHGGEVSGFMREVDGKTVGMHDPRHKRRDDHLIEDAELRRLIQRRVQLKVAPLIRKVHWFEATRMERYLVGCYDSASSGHFRAHRDNTTKGTAHRRFAMSVNLNEDYEGGELCFPEYGTRTYKMPAGCALIFSGALLHAVTPMRKGRRFAFLPFLYDEAAAALREKNNPHLAPEIGAYRA